MLVFSAQDHYGNDSYNRLKAEEARQATVILGETYTNRDK